MEHRADRRLLRRRARRSVAGADRVSVVHVLTGEPYDVYVGRANGRYGLPLSPYANPYRISRAGSREERSAQREEAIALYERWVRGSADPAAVWIREHVAELIGKTLAC